MNPYLFRLLGLLGLLFLFSSSAQAITCCCSNPDGSSFCITCHGSNCCTIDCINMTGSCGCAAAAPVTLSGEFLDVPVGQVVRSLFAGSGLQVSVEGNLSAPLTVSFRKATISSVLQEIQEKTGVYIQVSVPENAADGRRGSICGVFPQIPQRALPLKS